MDNDNSVLVALGLEEKRDRIVSLSLAIINLLLMFHRPHACHVWMILHEYYSPIFCNG